MVACLMNAKRCGRTHCRFTDPYYLAMILPVILIGSVAPSIGLWGWIVLVWRLYWAASSYGGYQSARGRYS
jgi:hypothetical protein